MKCPYCNKIFNSWKSVRGHVSGCNKNSHVYLIHLDYGPLHYSEFINITSSELRNKYPKLLALNDIRKQFGKYNISINYSGAYEDTQLLNYIKEFYIKYNRIPHMRDFISNPRYPTATTIHRRFGSWNEAIKAAGFEPNENDGFGVRTVADDGILYRSHYETMFVNKFLFNKEIYEYEVKYPNHNKYYDFYLPKRNLYIEIDGGCRPIVMEEKIKINKELGRNLLVIKGSEVSNFSGL